MMLMSTISSCNISLTIDELHLTMRTFSLSLTKVYLEESMRKVAVSLAAVMMVLASFATPSFAAGDSSTYNGTQFSGSITAPTVVKAGATLTARGTITLNTDESAARK